MESKCKATTREGAPCKAPPLTGRDYCYHHDESVAEERTAAKRRGAMVLHYGAAGKPEAEPVRVRAADDVLRLLETAASDLLARKPSFQRARALAYVAGVALKALEVGDLAERIEKLEEGLKLRSVS